MNVRGLAYIFMRILAIYILIQGIQRLFTYLQFINPNFRGMLEELNFSYMLWAYTIPAILMVILSIVLWLFAKKWSTFMIADRTEELNLDSDRFREWYVLAFTVAGIVIFVTTISPLMMHTAELMRIRASGHNFIADVHMRGHWLQWWGTVAKLALGIVLVIGAKGLYNILQRIRNVGSEK